MNLARRYLALLPQELPGAIPLERAMQGGKRGERKKPGKKSPAKARSAAGEEDGTTVYVVPKPDFPEWLRRENGG